MSNTTDCQPVSASERVHFHPTIAFFCVLLVAVGIPGNCLILHVYTNRITAPIFGFFIKILAGLDLLNAFGITPSFVLSKLIISEHVNLSLVCKFLSWLRYVYTTTTGTLYLVIAVQRYKKICRPHGPQLEAGLAKKVTCVCIMFCFISGLPVFFILTNNLLRVQWIAHNTTCVSALTCDYTETAKRTNISLIFSVWLFFFVVCIFISLIVLYSSIALQLRRHARRVGGSSTGRVKKSSLSVTWTFFILTVIYLLSVAPRLVQSVYFSQTRDFQQLTFTQLQMSDIAIYLPSINCVANFFIYSLSYRRFRREMLFVLSRQSNVDHAMTPDISSADRYVTHTTAL